MELPFHDNIDEVPSNHEICLKLAERVYDKLEADGEADNYNQIFFGQEAEDQLEEFECPPDNFKDHNWNHHFPVYTVQVLGLQNVYAFSRPYIRLTD